MIEQFECDYCKGSGFGKNSNEYTCPKCKGIGELNWLEMIFGKQKEKSVEEMMNEFYKAVDESLSLSRDISKNLDVFNKKIESILG
jgi:RecJ-like exonuclease